LRSHDEFGQMAKVFNQVGPQLEAHYDLRRSLDLAREVQQNLLPGHPPEVRGLDVCGQSRYCDQTGGDYYDYLVMGTPDAPRLLVIVGDVAGHGISSALLMATARALIRQRLHLEGDLNTKLADVNRLLCRDVGDSGQFMTLFVVEISALDGGLIWVRAGHEPGWCYSPATDCFETLEGKGVPLGVMADAEFSEKRRHLAQDELLVVGTDGIWESLDPQGRMYGKARLEALLRKHAHLPACRIVEAVMDDLEAFRQGTRSVDDATLMVVKRTPV
ncbi:MAG: PP2C family protein-serine/threonine phosphatase, partial [Desulfosarcinaceae bacterium]